MSQKFATSIIRPLVGSLLLSSHQLFNFWRRIHWFCFFRRLWVIYVEASVERLPTWHCCLIMAKRLAEVPLLAFWTASELGKSPGHSSWEAIVAHHMYRCWSNRGYQGCVGHIRATRMTLAWSWQIFTSTDKIRQHGRFTYPTNWLQYWLKALITPAAGSSPSWKPWELMYESRSKHVHLQGSTCLVYLFEHLWMEHPITAILNYSGFLACDPVVHPMRYLTVRWIWRSRHLFHNCIAMELSVWEWVSLRWFIIYALVVMLSVRIRIFKCTFSLVGFDCKENC